LKSEDVLGRPERHFDVYEALQAFRDDRILVTGASGSIGSRLVELLRDFDVACLATDREPRGVEMCVRVDITREYDVLWACSDFQPTLIVNLAAQKCAVAGEANPWQTLYPSIVGTQNLVNMGVRVVQASTCKAADPEVAYGIGKAAAEKLVLDAGGSVIRFFNVWDAGANVVSTWDALLGPIPVTPCVRYLISMDEAIGGLVSVFGLSSGRYMVDPGDPVPVWKLAERLYPGRKQVWMAPRRGDRLVEPLHARCEGLEPSGVGFLSRIVAMHDCLEAA
jgi:FlaA1/EpsC-like NDP-sugar epimerase